jgi:hypothetical protein
MASRGLPPIIMKIAMTIVWFVVAITSLPFAAVASVVLMVAWFVVKNGALLGVAATAAVGTLGAYFIYYAG